jgi:hypothetical protein
VARPFWTLFQPPFELGGEPWRAMLDVAERAGEFAVRGCTLADAPHAGSFTITFRCCFAVAVQVKDYLRVWWQRGQALRFEARRPAIWVCSPVLQAAAAAAAAAAEPLRARC